MPRRGLLLMIACAAAIVTSCARSSEGTPTAEVAAPPASTATETAAPADQPDEPMPGVIPTAETPVGSGVLCAPSVLAPVRVAAEVSDPAAPTATLAVPDGWSMSSGSGDVGARLDGPSGLRATVTIAVAEDDPEASFRRYTDELTADKNITTVSVLPGDMCGLSGQKLMGILSDGTDTVEYRDRIVYVPTAGGPYLIAVHVEAPSGTPGFDEPAAALTEDFEIGIP